MHQMFDRLAATAISHDHYRLKRAKIRLYHLARTSSAQCYHMHRQDIYLDIIGADFHASIAISRRWRRRS